MTPVVQPAPSAEPARFLLDAAVPWWDLVCFGPPGHEVYLRVRFTDDENAEKDEGHGNGEVGEPERTERIVLEVLAGHTRTPGRCWAAVWEGWTSRGRVPAAPVVDVPKRRMVLFQAPVGALHDLPSVAWGDRPFGGWPSPHLAWPADRAWTFACDVDEEEEFTVGCNRTAAAAIVDRLGAGVREVGYGTDPSPVRPD